MPLFIDKIYWYKLIKSLLGWLGTPHKHLQMEKGKGADCALFIADCLKEIGILNKVTFNYHPRFWDLTKSEVLLDHILDYIKNNFNRNYILKKVKDRLIRGDIVTFNLRSKVSNHIGLYMGNGLIINSLNNRGVCIIPIFKNCITNIFRVYQV